MCTDVLAWLGSGVVFSTVQGVQYRVFSTGTCKEKRGWF